MRSLLDVNVTIALLDPDHVFHERAHRWWAAQKRFGWASCPLTENGVVRIMSNPAYSAAARFTPGDLIARLRLFAARTNHEFWPDSLSIRDENVLVAERVHGARQLTDLYLLALAVNRGGRLATFDRSVPLSAVPSAESRHLTVI
ncbi:MAG: TA system VapC family ribonuclease toxin [Vicinamibacterales bacterium]